MMGNQPMDLFIEFICICSTIVINLEGTTQAMTLWYKLYIENYNRENLQVERELLK